MHYVSSRNAHMRQVDDDFFRDNANARVRQRASKKAWFGLIKWA